jgi:hypothetical protein
MIQLLLSSYKDIWALTAMDQHATATQKVDVRYFKVWSNCEDSGVAPLVCEGGIT